MPSSLTAQPEPGLSRRDNSASRRTLNPDLELREIVRILRRRRLRFLRHFSSDLFSLHSRCSSQERNTARPQQLR
jgi:hypothetical protein